MGKNKWFVITPPKTGDSEAMGREVRADQLAIEPSGAVTFWDHLIPGQTMELVIAFGGGHWESIVKIRDESNAGIGESGTG